jgi:hypothetical protein
VSFAKSIPRNKNCGKRCSQSKIISGGILSGYSFFGAPVRVEEVLRGVEQLLFGKD